MYLWVFVILFHITLSAQAATITGKVVSVADGDTITVIDANLVQHRVRLAGIDAPERSQAFGQRAKENLSRLTFNKDVLVEWEKRDRYGRVVGKVLVRPDHCQTCSNMLDACLAQISAGLAWWYQKYERDQLPEDAAQYKMYQLEARVKRVGLWSDADPVPPRDWRKRTR